MYIRQATSEDIERLVPLFDGYRVFYRKTTDLEGARAFLSQRLTKKDSIIYIAFAKPVLSIAEVADSAIAVGFTQLYPIFSSVSMEPMYILNDLFIAPDYRGQGIGQSLIATVKDLCRKEHQKGIVIQTEATNPAQHLYERLRFKKDPDLHYFWATK